MTGADPRAWRLRQGFERRCTSRRPPKRKTLRPARPYGGLVVSDGFADSMLESPVGVALLARLESQTRNRPAHGLVVDSPQDAVNAAADAIHDMSFGELLEQAVLAGEDVGPWISDATTTAASAYRHAEQRAPIARALNDRFGVALHAGIDRDAQQWWTTELSAFSLNLTAPLFRRFEHVYDAGQFTWAGLWTATDPPGVAHSDMIDAWELYPGPVTRWHLPVLPEARVFEIHRPADWARLVIEHPREAASHLEYWELPSANQNQAELSALMTLPGQRAARTHIRRHLVPDWRSVADHYDGVHLSWAGFITAEGCITDLDGGDVTMLRYWSSERTHWLADVFGEPEPAPPPSSGRPQLTNQSTGANDARTDSDRRRHDVQSLTRLLGR